MGLKKEVKENSELADVEHRTAGERGKVGVWTGTLECFRGIRGTSKSVDFLKLE